MNKKSFVLVKLIKGWTESLWYEVPESLFATIKTGLVVEVPLRNSFSFAVVTRVSPVLPRSVSFKLRTVSSLAKYPDDDSFNNFIKLLAQFYFVAKEKLHRRMLGFLESSNKTEKSLCLAMADDEKSSSVNFPNLTEEQCSVLDSIEPFIKDNKFKPFLLHGVTGSGKTEIYKRLIISVFNEGKSTLFLFPEVSLCVRFYSILRAGLPKEIKIFRFDSASSVSEKRALWKILLDGSPCLILGVHLPVLLPVKNLGLIIVDEEHESGYEEKKFPRLNSKEVAVLRAQHYKVPIVLGSATPSVSSLNRVETMGWKKLTLSKRFKGVFPEVAIVSLAKKNRKKRKHFWISEELEAAIKERLSRSEQVIIFMNRRGHSFFVQCGGCGYVFECENCSVSRTLHKDSRSEWLCCHYCDSRKEVPLNCPDCEVKSDKFIKKGIGTQRIVSILEEMFPEARIARADMDTASKKKQWEETAEKFYHGNIDIMVGTKTITKGYHFPRVTLVGVVWGDLDLNFPSYNARESAVQQLIQVAGRAGRSSIKGSQVIVQVLKENPVFEYLSEEKYLDFCKTEFEARKFSAYPPFGRLLRIEIKSKTEALLDEESEKISKVLFESMEKQGLRVSVLGPAKPPVFKLQGVHVRHILIKANSFDAIHKLLNGLNDIPFYSSITFNPIL
jgi:primosomal protein N' (replication factor Y) (superfamily II helicase)